MKIKRSQSWDSHKVISLIESCACHPLFSKIVLFYEEGLYFADQFHESIRGDTDGSIYNDFEHNVYLKIANDVKSKYSSEEEYEKMKYEVCRGGEKLSTSDPQWPEYDKYCRYVYNSVIQFEKLAKVYAEKNQVRKLQFERREQRKALLKSFQTRILPIRPGQNIIKSKARAAYQFCRLGNRFGEEITKKFMDVGAYAASENGKPRYRIEFLYTENKPKSSFLLTKQPKFLRSRPTDIDWSKPVSVFHYNFSPPPWSPTPVFVEFTIDLKASEKEAKASGDPYFGHSMGGLMFVSSTGKRYAMFFNGYGYDMVSYTAFKQAYQFDPSVTVLIFPNDFDPSREGLQKNYRINLQNEREWTGEGECQEFAVVIPYAIMKAEALKPLLTPGLDDTDALYQTKLNIAKVYGAGMTLSMFNEYRRQAGLLGGYAVVGEPGSRLLFDTNGLFAFE